MLAGEIGDRNTQRPAALARAADYIGRAVADAGYEVRRQCYEVDGVRCTNLEAELAGGGRSRGVFVLGAHYDSVAGCPGANDNATGVAAVLALARRLRGRAFDGTVRFVLFANEEPPYFRTPLMGSYVYARNCRRRGDEIAGMMSLETIGFYSDAPGSQRYPFPLGAFYPAAGDFIAFVGNLSSRGLVRRVVGAFRARCRFPSEGAALPGFVPGVRWSDHWAFWKHGYRALMATDTAPFRYPWYHTPEDTPDKVDYDRTARVTEGLARVVEDLAGPNRQLGR
jgi:Zn-dependent M28 family amino/carboxypeptidase